MDSKACYFDKNDVNLTDAKKSDSEGSSFIENKEGRDGKTLSYENEFQSINQENFSEPTIQAINEKSKLGSEIVNTTSNPIVGQIQTLGNEEDTQRNRESLRNEAQDDRSRGSARLVRLQVASEHATEHRSNVGCDIAVSNTNSSVISFGDLTKGIFTHESKIKNGSDSHKIVFSEEDCNFFSSQIPSVKFSSNYEENVLLSDASCQPVIQSEDQNITPTSSEEYEQVVVTISDTTVSNPTMLRIEKVQSCSSTDTKAAMWIVNSSDCGTSRNTNGNATSQHSENSLVRTSDYQSSGNLDEIPDTQQMQKFITADNQVVYGYKDPNGEFHFFCPAMNERESHNEKERKRRSRVSDACSALRKMIPGINEKTDKATVFEQASRYLKFLREKFGTQFDQTYCEKYYKDRS